MTIAPADVNRRMNIIGEVAMQGWVSPGGTRGDTAFGNVAAGGTRRGGDGKVP